MLDFYRPVPRIWMPLMAFKCTRRLLTAFECVRRRRWERCLNRWLLTVGLLVYTVKYSGALRLYHIVTYRDILCSIISYSSFFLSWPYCAITNKICWLMLCRLFEAYGLRLKNIEFPSDGCLADYVCAVRSQLNKLVNLSLLFFYFIAWFIYMNQGGHTVYVQVCSAV